MLRTTTRLGGRITTALLLLAGAIIGRPGPARAGWPAGDLPICTLTGSQTQVTIVPDGRGGVLIGWKYGTYSAVMAQRVDADGNALWTANGVLLPDGSGPGSPDNFMVPDEQGGLIYAWEIGGDLYAQHVDSTGAADWNLDPVWGIPTRVPLCTEPTPQQLIQITSDGAGGIIATWEDHRNGANRDIYAQRVDASGNPVWTTDGVPVCLDPGKQNFPVIAADGAGGAFILWQDQRNPSTNSEVYIQRIDASGNPLWTVDGIKASEALSVEDRWPGIVSDETGGAILAWTHRAPNEELQLRRVRGDGTFAWTYTFSGGTGVFLGAAEMVATGDGGVVVVSQQSCVTSCDIYAFRLDSLGVLPWGTGGVPVCAEPGDQLRPTAALDDAGVLHVAWLDKRSGPSTFHLYTQRVDATGSVIDTVGGVPLSLNPRTPLDEPVMTWIPGGVVAAYTDQRNGDDDVFATMFATVATGITPISPPKAALSPNWPNPFRVSTRLSFALGEPRHVDLAVYDVAGRRVKTLFAGDTGAGPHLVEWDGTGRGGRRVASGVYFVRMRSGGKVVSRTITLLR